MRPEPMTGFILAGGRSLRMGRDKALLDYDGRTFVERVTERLRPLVRRVTVVANARNAEALRGLPLDEVIVDLVPGQGPLMGVYTALMRTETPLNLFVPCDMLWVDGELVELLSIHCAQRVPGGGPLRAAAALHPLEGLEPFPFVCHVSAVHEAARFMSRPGRSVRDFLLEGGGRVVPIINGALLDCFRNVDTTDDYRRYCGAG